MPVTPAFSVSTMTHVRAIKAGPVIQAHEEAQKAAKRFRVA
jgi:hypothetical protein